jgi:hypothetical protein
MNVNLLLSFFCKFATSNFAVVIKQKTVAVGTRD